MSHSYAHNPVHLVFSTKERRKSIPKELQPKLWAYLAGTCKKHRITNAAKARRLHCAPLLI